MKADFPSPKRAAVLFIFITVVLDMLALGIIIPVLPKLIESFLGGDTAKAAKMVGLFATAWAGMQFFCSPILGVLSDRFGRRPVILLSNLGLGIDYIFMALAPTLGLLFLGRVISGITSSNIAAAGAYISDVTPADKRSRAFGMIGMAFGIGFILGPALGGVLGDINPRLPFWGAAVLSLANTLYGVLVLPESLARENRTAFQWNKANPVGALKLLRSRAQLFYLSLIGFLMAVAHVVLPSVFVLYASFRYGWNAKEIGVSLAGVGVCAGVVQGALVSPAVKHLGERRTLLLGLIFGIFGFTVFGMAKTGSLFCVGIPFIALWGLANAVIQGMMTENVSATEQGQLQGAIGSIRGISELIGPAIFTMTFAFFIQAGREFPGAPFFLAIAMLLAAGAVVWWKVKAVPLLQ